MSDEKDIKGPIIVSDNLVASGDKAVAKETETTPVKGVGCMTIEEMKELSDALVAKLVVERLTEPSGVEMVKAEYDRRKDSGKF